MLPSCSAIVIASNIFLQRPWIKKYTFINSKNIRQHTTFEAHFVPFFASCWNFFSSIDTLIAFWAYENNIFLNK
jgi:hypothetical protein